MTRLLTERLLEAADRVPPLAAHDLRALLEVAADTIIRLDEELVAVRDEAAQREPLAWVTADTVDGQSINGKPRRIWWENNEGVGIPLYTAPQPELAKYQPCGCVICTCEHETQCQGCGAKYCVTHRKGDES